MLESTGFRELLAIQARAPSEFLNGAAEYDELAQH